ncbi:hypothetical protein [Devosia submarina]|uniref:hypothetical protein n=1 Tax=Devosia submarina TaxID=1173082 RepID=UPI000D35BB0E|nr:hypothetical protein [Devosia submarina]
MSLQASPHGTSDQPHSLGFNLAGIALLVLLGAVGVAYLVDELGRQARIAAPTLEAGNPVSQTISGHELTIPESWFKFGEQLKPGFTNQIDLRVVFEPAPDLGMPVDITLMPRSRARTSAALLDTVYLHQFDGDTLGGVPGLIGKPMEGSSGYQGETVWYDALSPNPFVAKCIEPVAAGSSVKCVRTVYLPSGIAATFTFDAAALQYWRQFDDGMELWLARIGAWS